MKKTKLLPSAENAYEYPLLIKSLLLSGKRYSPNREIVYSDITRYDYLTLNERIARLANALEKAGIGAGDTVAVMDWDSNRYLEAYFAIPMIGAVLHHVNIRLSPDQIIYTMNHAEDDMVLVHDDFLPLVEQVAPELNTVRGYIQLTDSSTAAPTTLNVVGEYESMLAEALSEYDFPDFDENSIATTFYTTGTTGNPKGVYFSHRQLVLHTLVTAISLGSSDANAMLRSDDVYMPMTPMFHVHAWGVPYIATMLGVKQVYPGRYEPNRLVQLFRDEGVTFSHGVPTVLQMVLNCEEAKSTDLSGWNMLTGGSAPTQALSAQMADRGINFVTAYGMSETCPVITMVNLKDEERALPIAEQSAARILAGVATPLVDIRIVDTEGKDVPHDGESVGEVVARAPWLTQGYLKEPEKGAELWEGGWLHTGDVGSIDGNSTLQIKDRIKDVIKTGGEWISTIELENLISKHEAVSEVAVVGVPDERWDERPVATIVVREGADVSSDAIKAHLKQFVESGEIAKWAIPERIEFVYEIPKTSVGKINKKLIRSELDA
ncbi:fatty acid--CoA ligase [Marinobacter sp. 2_MG-2023]|uniref:fatty acid--CoA ligase n=1 Tax=Marinobacter sp. 2_MG-2023 TaxID=3062679 RepID=UPI0026E33E39|nr:fatty acid--CoA ligase [Marinobacter sp. 2_MG-2023]MDO6442290.1 fatty acid--CoA ligase [Marinobacter sp. 2_MG-2023]